MTTYFRPSLSPHSLIISFSILSLFTLSSLSLSTPHFPHSSPKLSCYCCYLITTPPPYHYTVTPLLSCLTFFPPWVKSSQPLNLNFSISCIFSSLFIPLFLYFDFWDMGLSSCSNYLKLKDHSYEKLLNHKVACAWFHYKT